MDKTPVLIVGAGPTGLVLAIQLARRNIPFRIIDKNSGPGQASRAMVLQARTLEFYRQLGFAEEVVAAGIRMERVHLREGTEEKAAFDLGDIGSDLSPYPFALSFPQGDHERLLVKQLQALGRDVEWDTELIDLQADDGPQLAMLFADGQTSYCEATFVCGCDGAHSRVRSCLGIDFPGGTYEHSFFVSDVVASGPLLSQDVNVCLSDTSFFLIFPVRSSGTFRLLGAASPHDDTFEDVRLEVEAKLGIHVDQVNWYSLYRVHHRVADRFSVGRAFLCGDAGHVHSPAGGQGMNTGIGDAVNLGWKLAQVLQGRADPTLLETYEPERIRFARSLVRTTDRLFEAAVGRSLWQRFLRVVALPRFAPPVLRLEAGRRAAFRLVSQIRVHYRNSELSAGQAGQVRGGDRLPWSAGNFDTLQSLDWQVHVYGQIRESLRMEAAALHLPLHQLPWVPTTGLQQDAAYLIRPDGYVALADPEQDGLALREFLARFRLLGPSSEQPPVQEDVTVSDWVRKRWA